MVAPVQSEVPNKNFICLDRLNRMDLEPGMNYIIPMTRGSWSFKKSCISFWNQTNIETFQNKAIMQMLINFQYDQHVCHGYCQLESIYKHCGCISTSYESIRTRQEGFVEANGTIARVMLFDFCSYLSK